MATHFSLDRESDVQSKELTFVVNFAIPVRLIRYIGPEILRATPGIWVIY